MDNTAILSYQEIREVLKTHYLFQFRIPIEHYVSLPMPTKRWKLNAYAVFTSPALRTPNKPPVQKPPMYWFLLRAETGALAKFSEVGIEPFTPEGDWQETTVKSSFNSIVELESTLQEIERLMNSIVIDFFLGDNVTYEQRSRLRELLQKYIPDSLHARYQLLTPDFFNWLKV